MEEIISRTVEFLFVKNGIVAVPVFCTVFIILFKAASCMSEFDSDSIKSVFKIGLDLAIAGIFVLLANISFSVPASANYYASEITNSVYRYLFIYGIKILLYLVIVLVFSLGIKVFTWDKETASPKNTWKAIIATDVIGILLLVLSIFFAGGNTL